MTSTFYTQHELTPAEIRRDQAKQAAIARNRKSGHTPRTMDEMRYHSDSMSPAQGGLVDSLLEELRRVDPDTFAKANAWFNGTGPNDPGVRPTMTKGRVTDVINRLKLRINEGKQRTSPPTARQESESARTGYTPVSRDRFTDVPDGYYAVMTEENVLAFYRVSTWQKSGDRKVQVKASDVLHLIKGYKATDAILAKIRRDTPPVAARLFARELKQCYRCGRDLTDEESRGNGLGPVCITKI